MELGRSGNLDSNNTGMAADGGYVAW